MNERTKENIKKIKQSFRLYMNGAVAQSMREKGLDYHLNWGIQLPQIKELASEYSQDEDLARALWRENVRECKIMATLLMPRHQMSRSVAELWMTQLPSVELAQLTAFHLLQYLPDAFDLAFRAIASQDTLLQVCGYQILAGLFTRSQLPDSRRVDEYLDTVSAIVGGDDLQVAHAAVNSLNRYAAVDDASWQRARQAFPQFF